MEKIYGYKRKDIIGLAEFLHQRGNASLTETFEKYAVLHGKAKGTVRNLYYALAKRSNEDKEFCDAYLGGNPIKVGKITEFDYNEERDLIKNILLLKTQTKSVRGAIMKLANGDGKIALRYQNKFRNAIKNKPELITQIVNQLKADGKKIDLDFNENKEQSIVSDLQFNRLKCEINAMINRIALKEKKENQLLKERIAILERENSKLLNLVYGADSIKDARKFFNLHEEKKLLN